MRAPYCKAARDRILGVCPGSDGYLYLPLALYIMGGGTSLFLAFSLSSVFCHKSESLRTEFSRLRPHREELKFCLFNCLFMQKVCNGGHPKLRILPLLCPTWPSCFFCQLLTSLRSREATRAMSGCLAVCRLIHYGDRGQWENWQRWNRNQGPFCVKKMTLIFTSNVSWQGFEFPHRQCCSSKQTPCSSIYYMYTHMTGLNVFTLFFASLLIKLNIYQVFTVPFL